MRYCFRTLNKYPIVYGTNRYTYGIHHIRFQIEKREDSRLFFGVINSEKRVSRVITINEDNQSLYGWWGLSIVVIDGKVQRSREKSDVYKFDQLTLIVNCDEYCIELKHHRTQRCLQLPIDPGRCPFPWKLVVELRSYGDSIRIIQ